MVRQADSASEVRPPARRGPAWSEFAMRFVKESRIAASPSAVFAFHETPGALSLLTPPWEKVEVVEGGGSLRPGSRVVLKTKIRSPVAPLGGRAHRV